MEARICKNCSYWSNIPSHYLRYFKDYKEYRLCMYREGGIICYVDDSEEGNTIREDHDTGATYGCNNWEWDEE